MEGEWLTTKEAAESLNVSVRHVTTLIHQGRLRAKRDGKIWLVHRSLNPPDEEETGVHEESVKILKESLEDLRETIKSLREQITTKDKQIEELQQASERQDMITLQLTRQLEQSQRLLEHRRTPFWRRLRLRKREINRSME